MMVRRLLLVVGIVGTLVLPALPASGTTSSTHRTAYNVTQYFSVTYLQGTCSSSPYDQITQESIHWTRPNTDRKVTYANLRAEEVQTGCDGNIYSIDDQWQVTNVCWKTCTGNTNTSATYIQQFTMPKVLVANAPAVMMGGSAEGRITDGSGNFLGVNCTPVVLLGRVDCY